MKKSLVRDWMTVKVITADPQMRLHDALRRMNQAQIRTLPVVEDGRLAGIVTKRDLLRADVTTVMKDSWDQYRMVGNLTLDKIMTAVVITVPGSSLVARSARILLENKITALPVVDAEQHLEGILTSSDLFRLVLEELPVTRQEVTVGDYMTRDLQVIAPSTSLLDAQRLMGVKRIRSLPVVQDGVLVGIVTRTDLLSAAPSPVATQGRMAVAEQVLSAPIRFIMTSMPMTVQQKASVTVAARMMLENKIHSLPVMDDRQEMVGIITESDLFRMIVAKFL